MKLAHPGLRTWLLVLVLAAAMPLLALALYNAKREEAASVERARAQLALTSALAAGVPARQIESARDLLTAIAQTQAATQASTCSAYFEGLRGHFPGYANIGVVGLDGRILCSAVGGSSNVSIADRDYFRQVLAGAPIGVSTYQVGRLKSVPVIAFAIPVRDATGVMTGVVFASLNISEFDRGFASLALPEGARLMVMDRQGAVLSARTDAPVPIGELTPSPTLRQALAAGRTGVYEGPASDGQNRIFAFTKVAASRVDAADPAGPPAFHVSVSLPRETVLAPGRDQLWRHIAAIMAGSLAGIAAAWAIGGLAVARPAGAIVANTRRIGAGEMPVPAVVGPLAARELLDISRTVEQMGEALRQREAALTRELAHSRDANERLQLLGNAIARLNDMVVITEAEPLDEPGPRIVFVNDAFERITGWRREEVLDRSPRVLQKKGLDADTRATIRAALEERRPVRVEILNHTRDGAELWLEMEIAPVLDEAGHHTHFIAVQRDVTARRQAEQAVRRMTQAALAVTSRGPLDETLRELAGQARQVIDANFARVTVKGDGGWTEVRSTSGDTQVRLVTHQGDFAQAHPFDLAVDFAQPVRLSRQGQANHPRWARIRKAAQDGRADDGWLAVALVDRDGRGIGLLELADRREGEFTEHDENLAVQLARLASIAIEKSRLIDEIRGFNDELERKVSARTQELERQRGRFRALADEAPQVIWNISADGQVNYVNKAWFDLVGGGRDDWHGDRWIDVIHPDDQQTSLQRWTAARDAGKPFEDIRRFRDREGVYHTMSCRAVPVLDSAGHIDFWVGIDTDITAIKRIEEALLRSNQELEAFSYSVSHDLRSPLSAINGFARLLESQMPADASPRARHYLSRIGAGVRQMGQLIDDLLSLGRVSRAPMIEEAVDLSAMARTILGELQAAEPQRQASLRVDEGMTVRADSMLMRVALQNLLGNAWKFSARKPLTTIHMGRQPDTEGSAVFFVRDEGAGFDMTYADKLFGAFQRMHAQDDFTGTGVGLAIVKRIIERHHGRVWAQAAVDQGACFCFELPQDASATGGRT